MASGSLPRPAKGFTGPRAQKWVLTSALVTALIYTVRHLVEGDTSPAPASNAARQFLGQGSPPSFGQWAIAYGTAFLGLSLLAVAAPEVAASLAMFTLVVTFLESGGQLANDLKALEGGTAGSGAAGVTGTTSAAGAAGGPVTSGTAGTAGVTGGTTAPSPQSIGTTVANNSATIAALNKSILSEAGSLPAGYTVRVVNGIAELLHNGRVIQRG